ncbi:branched-chain amino acid ABC transporter permease [Pseudorhizobium endolithicum]|uniref:Branched-chain amino acid ABC transporter permease n=1 Tax=Pseudorhizobium endolithicum TaxID=1191678 RepID=A0ABM8PDA7_9HYPH|nr:AzlC family ABC transporter permease [Pseudorhizobium endolithicum]CAD7023607.1 branched-chain amino acid ABC transporter permease [Pseudorhizobium endolithicum]
MNRSDVKDGLRGGLIIALSSAPFGVLFGAVAVDNGLSFLETLLMSATVYAGASQLVGIELFGQRVEPWLVVLSIFAVNFRHILYSAALAKYIRHYSPLQKFLAFFLLVDPQFAEGIRRGESGEGVSFSWYLGFGTVIYVSWSISTMIGAWFGKMIGDPTAIGIDILLPVYFLGMVLAFRSRWGFVPVVAASAAGSVAAYHFVGSPWHVSLGAAAGILVATLLPLQAKSEPDAAVEAEG